MPKEKSAGADQPRNDGWTDVRYDLVDDAVLNLRLSHLLNEAWHVYRHHADGTWKSEAKDRYARKLGEHFEGHPWLSRRLLERGDRLLKMLTYRALELRGESAG